MKTSKPRPIPEAGFFVDAQKVPDAQAFAHDPTGPDNFMMTDEETTEARWKRYFDTETPEQFDYIALRSPWDALQHAADLLTPAQLDRAAAQEPLFAMKYASTRMTRERFDWCVNEVPGSALNNAIDMLTDEQLIGIVDGPNADHYRKWILISKKKAQMIAGLQRVRARLSPQWQKTIAFLE